MKAKHRIVAFDILNIIACFAVVCLHQNGAVHRFEDCIGWDIALGIECICYFAVPVFYMLSGSSLMRYDERYSSQEFIKKRLKRTFIPFVIWSLVGLCIGIFTKAIPIDGLSIIKFINGFLNTEFQPIYWFFIPLFILYALTPLLVLAKDRRHLLKYLIIFLFTLGPCYTLYCKLSGSEVNTFISNAIFGPMLYFLSGYYIYRWGLRKKWFIWILVLAVISLFSRYYFTYILSHKALETVRLLFGYSLPTAIFPSICVFLIVLKMKFKISSQKERVLSIIAGSSLGVYLIHQYLISAELHILNRWGLNGYSPIFLLCFPLLTWGICITIVTLIKKSQIGRIIFP